MKYKKVRERRILDYLYYADNFIVEDLNQEKPDFVLFDQSCESRFGVEITELYRNQDSAKNINQSGVVQDEVFVISIEEYQKLLNDRLLLKDMKYLNYNKSLAYTNLIIYDMERCLFRNKTKSLINLLLNSHLENALLSTAFNEVFFISEFNGKQNVLPLKLTVIINLINNIISYKLFSLNGSEMSICKSAYEILKTFGIKNMKIIKFKKYCGIGVGDYFIYFEEDAKFNKISHLTSDYDSIDEDLVISNLNNNIISNITSSSIPKSNRNTFSPIIL